MQGRRTLQGCLSSTVPHGVGWVFCLTPSFAQSYFLHSPTSVHWRTHSSKPPAHKLSQSLLPGEPTIRHVLGLSMMLPLRWELVQKWAHDSNQVTMKWRDLFWDLLGNLPATREKHRKRWSLFQTKPEQGLLYLQLQLTSIFWSPEHPALEQSLYCDWQNGEMGGAWVPNDIIESQSQRTLKATPFLDFSLYKP